MSRRRRRLALAFAPIALVLLAFACKVALMLGNNASGQDAYDQSRFPDAAQAFGRNRTLDVLEDWVASYNRGTALLQQRRATEARVDLERALERAPEDRDCMVRINLVAAMEAQAGDLLAAQRAAEARDLYGEALDVLAAGSCGQVDSGGADRDESERKAAEEAKERLEEKQQEADSKADQPEPEATPSGEPTASADPSDAEGKRQRLEERNREGQRENTEEQDYNEGTSEDPPPRSW